MNFRKRVYRDYSNFLDRRGRLVQPKRIPLRRPWLPHNKSAVILDIGCGLGETLLGLHAAGYGKLTGVDASEVVLARAREALPGEISLHHQDAFEFLQTHKGQYDIIIAYDFVEHLTKDEAVEICDAVFSSLKPNGTFVVKVPNSSNILGMFTRNIDFTHMVSYTDFSLFQLLDVAGFKDHHLVEANTSINLRIWRPWRPLTGFGLRPRISILLHKFLFWLLGTNRSPATFEGHIEAWTHKPRPESNATVRQSD